MKKRAVQPSSPGSTSAIIDSSIGGKTDTTDKVIQIPDVQNEPASLSSDLSTLKPKSLRDEKTGVFLLVSLYVLEGIPQGLMAAMPMMLRAAGATYSDIAFFSLTHYPFSLKVFWAPIVDSVYLKSFGRRRSWILPAQVIISMILFYLSPRLEGFLSATHIHIYEITFWFFSLYLMTATLDIAVDGWALAILSKQNRKYAATCQTAGLNFGRTFAFTGFLTLTSTQFSNDYLRSTPSDGPIIDISQFVFLCGTIFMVAFTIVAILPEKVTDGPEDNTKPLSIKQTLWTYKRLLGLKNVKNLLSLILTRNIAFGACDNLFFLMLMDKGVTKESIAILQDVSDYISLIIVVVFMVYFMGDDVIPVTWLKIYRVRWVFVQCTVFVLVVAPLDTSEGWFLVLFCGVSICIATTRRMMDVFMGSYFCSISDPAIGGTYMTMLFACSNLGRHWVRYIALAIVDDLSPSCPGTQSNGGSVANSPSSDSGCVTAQGFYNLSIICGILGFLWYFKAKKKVKELTQCTAESWRVVGAIHS